MLPDDIEKNIEDLEKSLKTLYKYNDSNLSDNQKRLLREFDEEELIKPVTDRFMELAQVKFR